MQKSWLCGALLGLLLSLVACTGSNKTAKVSTYGMKAKQMYLTGITTMKGGSYSEAKKVFERVKSKFPYSRYATLAELGIADTFFEAEKYLQGIDRYKLFARLHPSHPQVGYANFRIAHSYYKLRPWSLFILPPAHEKDATTTRQAIKALNFYLKYHPKDKHVPKAKKFLKECRLQMAKHEMYVGRYYARLRKYRALAWRMQHLLKNYNKAGLDAEALYRLGWAHYQLKEMKKAKKVYNRLLKQHPNSDYISSAKSQLVAVNAAIKNPKASKKPAKRPAARRALPLIPNTAKPTVRRSTPQ